jgi:hypothetical protein
MKSFEQEEPIEEWEVDDDRDKKLEGYVIGAIFCPVAQPIRISERMTM